VGFGRRAAEQMPEAREDSGDRGINLEATAARSVASTAAKPWDNADRATEPQNVVAVVFYDETMERRNVGA